MATQPLSLQQLAEEDFFKLIGMEQMSDKDKEAILNTMNETVQARVYFQIFEQLSEEERKQMDELKGEDLLKFLEEKGFDLVLMSYEEALRYRFEVAQIFQLATTPMVQQAA